MVANRLPVDLERLPDGTTRWKAPAPAGSSPPPRTILRSNKGAWVAGAGVPDVDLEPIVEDGLDLYPVPLSGQEVADYYEGFSNATLWPLYHDVIVKPSTDVNGGRLRRGEPAFAEATSKAAAEGATVWIQDYQLQLVPKMLRMLRPISPSVLPAHPVPAGRAVHAMPWRREIVEGLRPPTSSDSISGGAQNFMFLARRLAGQQTSGALSVSAPSSASCRSDSAPSASRLPDLHRFRQARRAVAPQVIRDRAKQIRKELGNPNYIMLGARQRPSVDYTQGHQTCASDALYELLQEGRVDPADTVMVHAGNARRERVESYVQIARGSRRTVSRINGEYA
ncbi:trehalose-6-phosphate synthase, partial [Rhodococcus hoagii]|nr:trehalose-6-phosphate synthase [Prescottella equi]